MWYPDARYLTELLVAAKLVKTRDSMAASRYLNVPGPGRIRISTHLSISNTMAFEPVDYHIILTVNSLLEALRTSSEELGLEESYSLVCGGNIKDDSSLLLHRLKELPDVQPDLRACVYSREVALARRRTRFKRAVKTLTREQRRVLSQTLTVSFGYSFSSLRFASTLLGQYVTTADVPVLQYFLKGAEEGSDAS